MNTLPPHTQDDNTPLKHCSACDNFYPATPEFFSRQKHGKYGVTSQCRTCRKAKKKALPKPFSDVKCCSICGNEFPTTTEFFRRNKKGKGGLINRCKACHKQIDTVYRNQPEAKERRLTYVKAYYKRPDIREKQNAKQRVLNKRPERQAHRRAYERAYLSRPEIQEKLRTQRMAYSSRPEVQERNKARYKANYSRPEIRDRYRVNRLKRIAREKAISGNYTSAQIQELLRRQHYCCYYCSSKFEKRKGRYVYHIDHTFPLSRVIGTNIPANDISYLVLACPTCNHSKNNKFPWEWPEGGRLL